MVASSLGLDEELDTEAESAEGHQHGGDGHAASHAGHPSHSFSGDDLAGETTSLEGEEEGDFLHPWAQEMYRQGLSFNGNERTRLFINGGAEGFLDLSDVSGADSPLDGRALIAADFDDDMDLDLFVHNIQRERHNLFRNDLGRGRSIKVRLRATSGQYEAVGARVIVRTPNQSVAQLTTRGGGFASCQAPELIFGLGDAPSATVEVLWPWGEMESFGKVAAGERVLLVEGAGKPESFEAAPAPLPDAWADGLKIAVGEKVPELVLAGPDGERMEVRPAEAAQAAGGELWLCFWASYCRPCVAELPQLQELHDTAGAGVLAISVDVPDDRDRASAMLQRAGTNFPAYYLATGEEDNEGALDELVDLLRLPIPTAIRIGPNGQILEVIQGPLPALSHLVPNVGPGAR